MLLQLLDSMLKYVSLASVEQFCQLNDTDTDSTTVKCNVIVLSLCDVKVYYQCSVHIVTRTRHPKNVIGFGSTRRSTLNDNHPANEEKSFFARNLLQSSATCIPDMPCLDCYGAMLCLGPIFAFPSRICTLLR